MAIQSEWKSPSRRALLAGALGGLGAWAASAIGRASSVAATDGQALVQGADNSGTQGTLVRVSTTTAALQGLADASSGTTYGLRGRNSSTQGAGVYGVATASSGTSRGVLGITSSSQGAGVRGEGPALGVQGVSSGGPAVGGYSVSGSGVYGQGTPGILGYSDSGNAVFGWGPANDEAAVVGMSAGSSTGVLGYSAGAPVSPIGKAKTGVYGYAGQDSSSKGIYGESPAGWAGYFAGKLYTSKFLEMKEIANPSAPPANHARLFVRDDGSGRTQLCVRFHNGVIRVLATA